jgi:catechol 2,3-dioxygenase-like lactoylglutathione lyase family enzyme
MIQSIAHVALLVHDCDEAIAWFTQRLDLTLVEDSYRPAQDKRWVIIDYGKVAVFEDLYGNLWDLVEFSERRADLPAPASR